MELKSDPKQYENVQVTDLDIAFPGDLRTYVLWEGKDSYKRVGNDLIVTFGTGGTVTHAMLHVHWVAARQRTMRVVVEPKTQAVSQETE